ncbi:pentapeptide repeat-containing protein [Dapis sp. BLCC M172]|uniref:pentapeptide repeat-containing protein n=1 Tax=Dapis sp. BLCC M172 TaxID=2975281 RepID=UPI003CEEBB3C
MFNYSTITIANLHGVDFTNADLSDGVFVETIMLGSVFDGLEFYLTSMGIAIFCYEVKKIGCYFNTLF